MHNELYSTRTLESEVRQLPAVWSLLFAGRHHLELLAVLPRDRHCYYVSVSSSRREPEVHRMLFVPTLPELLYYFGAFGNVRKSFRRLLRKPTAPDFMLLTFVYFIRVAEFSALDFFLLCRSRAPGGKARSWATDEVFHCC